MNPIIDINFTIFEKQNEIRIYYEWLITLNDIEQIDLAKMINDSKLTSIRLECIFEKNEGIKYSPKFLEYLEKENIKKMAVSIIIDSNLLLQFKDIKDLIYINNKNYILDLSHFTKLKNLSITKFYNNVEISDIHNLDSLCIWNSEKFDYSKRLSHLNTLTLNFIKNVDFTNMYISNLKKLSLFKIKNIIINEECEFLKNIEYLTIDSCNINFINNNIFSKMINLKELFIEKVDLSNFDEATFKSFVSLRKLVISECKNLKTIKGIKPLERIVILNTKIMDLDVEPILKCEEKVITNCRGYNYKIK